MLLCVVAVSACTTAPVPARVDSANWWGAQATWNWVAKTWAMQRAMTRRKTSPMTSPRMPPLGLVSATIRPNPMACAMFGGTRACAKCWHTSTKRAVVASSSKTSRSVSAVRPDGPGAAPFLERRRAVSNLWAGSCRGCSGTNWSMLACKGVYGSVGLRVGSRSCANVAAVPGAKGLAVSACRAAESSPWCTKCLARYARRSDEGAGWCVAAGGPAGSPSVGPVVANSCCHSPAWNAVRRARHSSFGKVRVPQGRCKSIRGNKSHSVHARVVSCSVCAARICSRL